LVRSHFGDLQFFHAMASADGEAAQNTYSKILVWSEFAWRVSLGEYGAETAMVNVELPGFDDLFRFNKEWRIQDLYALGNPHIRSPEAMRKVAFGNLLHLVEDSFARGHVERRDPIAGQTCAATALPQPGKILEFHSYSKQNPSKHGNGDSREAFSAHWSADHPGVIDVGKALNTFFQNNSPWIEVKPYLESVVSG